MTDEDKLKSDIQQSHAIQQAMMLKAMADMQQRANRTMGVLGGGLISVANEIAGPLASDSKALVMGAVRSMLRWLASNDVADAPKPGLPQELVDLHGRIADAASAAEKLLRERLESPIILPPGPQMDRS